MNSNAMSAVPEQPSPPAAAVRPATLTLAAADPPALVRLLGAFGLRLMPVEQGAAIPGSYWGEPEAGLRDGCLYARADTPLHSVLHEAAHFICMDETRRACLDRDAGGNHAEEDAVCYLQILLADHCPLAGARMMGRSRMCRDMDAWGYTFRLGAASRWFAEDAFDARAWLVARGILTADGILAVMPSAGG